MPVYTLSEMRKKTLYKDVRKFELEPNADAVKIWIPEGKVHYQVLHYNVKLLFPKCSWAGIECFKYEYNTKIKGCPVCAKIEELWAQWREVANKTDPNSKILKQQLQMKISQVRSEYFWMNIIPLNDPDRKFYANRFTPACKDEIDAIDEKYGIGHVTWDYKMKKEGKTSYILHALTEGQKEILSELNENLNKYKERPYEMGGLCNLESVSQKFTSLEAYLSILNGENTSETGVQPVSETLKTQEVQKPKIEEESISLDNLESTPVEKKKEEPKKEEPKKIDKIDDLELDLDNLKLEPIDIPEKIIEIEPKEINDKRNDKTFILKLFNFLLNKKFVEPKKEYKDQVVACFMYAKKEGKLKISEKEFGETIPF